MRDYLREHLREQLIRNGWEEYEPGEFIKGTGQYDHCYPEPNEYVGTIMFNEFEYITICDDALSLLLSEIEEATKTAKDGDE